MRIRWRTWRWCPLWFQITLLWDDFAWAFGVWLNPHAVCFALGYLFLDIYYRKD